MYSNAPTYYSTLHDSITSLCKTILPFNFKKKCLLSAEQRLSNLRSDNLKWQQDSFNQMLNLMGLHKEDIIVETEVLAFRTHLLDTLLDSCSIEQQDHPLILRDKLKFLQELLFAKFISEGEYHSAKRALIQKLAAQGAEIEARDMKQNSEDMKQISEEEWSVIDLKDEQCLINKENSNSKKKKTKHAMKKNVKGTTSMFSFVSSYKPGKSSMEKSIFELPTSHMDSTTHSRISPLWDDSNKVKRKPFRILFHKEKKEGNGGDHHNNHGLKAEEKAGKFVKKQWGFDGFMKLKKNDSDDEAAPLALNERLAKEVHYDGSSTEFCIDDKVFGDKIKKELSRIQTELRSSNPNLKFSNDQMEAISTKLPEDKAELKNYFPKSWCDQHGDGVLDVVKKEFKNHVGEMENMHKDAEFLHENSMGWTTFEDEENFHPNLFVQRDNSLHSSSINPFSYV
ncbi:PREDICTED: uncharacterized protein LOC109326976 isoform X2 [Lupinus angustifolius]|uniref:uncharacterized protein LOC109326976 isoform X2 n=1 Tax=Lupinus angustifolius TaxID=3871 RepID=UPI00092F29E6|nr:PREDICTED: uncharacterized protein LOC109326976 isoform X2 [Lupinus angustifolius]